MVYGNKPVEGGNLILTTEEKDSLIAREPQSAKWSKKLLGSDEFLNGKQRWCLWLTDLTKEDLDSLTEKHPLVAERVEKVRAVRLASKKAATVQKADIPHLFDEIRHPTSGNYILIPRVSSERREYVPMAFFDSEVISTDSNQIIPNATLYEFGILTSIRRKRRLSIFPTSIRAKRRSISIRQSTTSSTPWANLWEKTAKQASSRSKRMMAGC